MIGMRADEQTREGDEQRLAAFASDTITPRLKELMMAQPLNPFARLSFSALPSASAKREQPKVEPVLELA